MSGVTKATDRDWLKTRSKTVTGFCNGNNKPKQCEGTKPHNWRGDPLPTCEFWDTCPCVCHFNVDQLFKMTGQERILIPNPEYVRPESSFVIPRNVVDPLGTPALSSVEPMTPPDVQRPVGGQAAPVSAPLAQRRTPTGRTAKGGLEAQVWDACMNMPEDLGDLTPKMVSEWLGDKYKIPNPSTGAINYIWARWETLGFCELGKKPNRFIGFQHEGSWEELDRTKATVKRSRKSAQSAIRRGIRPVLDG